MPFSLSIIRSLSVSLVFALITLPSATWSNGMDEFWNIIDNSVRQSAGNPQIQLSIIADSLSSLTESELLSYVQSYEAAHQAAYTWALWEAAYVINGGASDDGFAYFRDWLIAQGRVTFETALTDPDSLAGKALPYEAEFEDLRYVGFDVYMALTGEEPLVNLDPITEPAGVIFDENSAGKDLPRLSRWIEANR